MSEIFFSADHHFFHENIIKYCNRPFSSAAEMNEVLISKHNEIVKPEDVVFFVGDFAFTSSSGTLAELLERMNGHKTIITGNHDNESLIGEVYKYGRKTKLSPINVRYRILELHGKAWGGYNPTLCHYPMLSWNRSFHGSFQLHGHTHGTVPFDPSIRRLDVGVDCHNFYPISWDEIVSKLKDIPTPKELEKLKELRDDGQSAM